MKTWESFEDNMANYLNDMLKDYDLEIKQFGNADSTKSDIEIALKKKNDDNSGIFIETKMPSSQTSQFVVELQNNEFKYGRNNKFGSNVFSDDIIEILNNNFEKYKNVGQSGFIVPVPETIAFGWIVSNMKNKNVEFIMSVDLDGNEKIIPVEFFEKLFNVKTILRRKKSGSAILPQKYYEDFKKLLSSKFDEYEIFTNNSRLYLKINHDLQKSECYLNSEYSNNKRYFLSKKDNNIYEVKLTSLTNNPNIIFELSVKNNIDVDTFSIQVLIDYIENME